MPLLYSVLAAQQASRWTRTFHRLAVLGVVAFSIFASLQVMAFAAPKVTLVGITIQTQLTDGVNLVSTKLEARPDKRGVVFIDLFGTADLPAATHLDLTIYPASEPTGFAQPWCCDVAKNAFYGKAQLGSPEHQVDQDEQYSFELKLAPAGVLVGRGTIEAQVEELTEQNAYWQTVVGVIGLLAAFLQIFFLLIPDTLSFTPQEAPDEKARPAQPAGSAGSSDAPGR